LSCLGFLRLQSTSSSSVCQLNLVRPTSCPSRVTSQRPSVRSPTRPPSKGEKGTQKTRGPTPGFLGFWARRLFILLVYRGGFWQKKKRYEFRDIWFFVQLLCPFVSIDLFAPSLSSNDDVLLSSLLHPNPKKTNKEGICRA
jgi:hypothetical protein